MKAQAALEYAMILGLVLVALIPVFYISFQNTNNEVKNTQATDLVNQIASAANTVYSLGPGATKYITINIPKGVKLATVSQNEVRLQISTSGGTSDITALAKTNISGSLPSQPGVYNIRVTNIDSKYVYIGSINDTSPPIISNVKPTNNSLLFTTQVQLSVITNEYAECRYVTGMSGFTNTSFATGTLFSSTGQTIHSTNYLPITQNGSYSYSINCKDQSGNIPGLPVRTNFTVNTSEDNDSPIINLVSPNNGTISNVSLITFKYNVTDATSNVANCTLIADGILDSGDNDIKRITDTSILENQTNQIQAVLDKGNYTWRVYCYDSSIKSNGNISLTRWVRSNQSSTGGFILSCVDYCIITIGRVSGGCDNAASCSHVNPGGQRFLNGDVYCTIPPSNYCCCTNP